jgi:homoprotocatechuate degradation regulator HpaR
MTPRAAASQADLIRAGADDPAGGTDPAPLRSFSRSLPMALLRCREAVMTRFRPMLRAHGISEQQWRILRALTSDGPMRATALAEHTLLSSPSLSRLLKGLAARKLIRRATSAEDLRAARISITDKGRRLVDEIAPLSEAIYAELAGAVGASQLDSLYHTLAVTTARLGMGKRQI